MRPPAIFRAAIAAFVAFVALPCAVAAQPSNTPLDLPGLLAHVSKTSPRLKLARARIDAVSARRAAVRKLPEPTFGVGFQPMPVETRVGPQRLKFSVRQGLPWLAKFDRRSEAIDAMTTAARRRYAAELVAVRRAVRVPWARRAWIRKVAAIVDKQRDLLIGLEPSVLARLRVGKAAYEDAQRLRLVIGELNERAASLRDKDRAVAAMVRASAGVTPTAALADATFETDALGRNPVPALASMLPLLGGNPALVAADAGIAAARAKVAVADTRRLPDVMFGVDWILVDQARMPGVADSGNDAVMLMATVKLPAWVDAYDAEVASARANVVVAQSRREAALRRAEARLADLLFALRDARRKRRLYRKDLVPRAKSALKTALTSYANGRARFNDLIELQRKLLVFEIRLASAELARVQAVADLEWLLGRPLANAASDTTEAKR